MSEAKWFQLYEARFGKRLSEPEIEVWEEEFRREIRNRQPGEISGAIRMLADDWRKAGNRKYAPTVNDLITAVIRARYIARNGESAADAAQTVISRMFSVDDDRYTLLQERHGPRTWQPRLLAASDLSEAWNIICEPSSPDECRARIQFAQTHGIAFERFKPSGEYMPDISRFEARP